MILCRIFCGGSSMKDSGVDSVMDSDSDLMMMDSGWITPTKNPNSEGNQIYGGSLTVCLFFSIQRLVFSPQSNVFSFFYQCFQNSFCSLLSKAFSPPPQPNSCYFSLQPNAFYFSLQSKVFYFSLQSNAFLLFSSV